jgi:hypothetical protein
MLLSLLPLESRHGGLLYGVKPEWWLLLVWSSRILFPPCLRPPGLGGLPPQRTLLPTSQLLRGPVATPPTELHSCRVFLVHGPIMGAPQQCASNVLFNNALSCRCSLKTRPGFSTDSGCTIRIRHLSEAVMLWADGKPVQSWREIAAEAAKETDPKKLVGLVETLCEALETIRLERSFGNLPRKPSKSSVA